MPKRLFLIDGMAILFRGYYALLNAHLSSRNGEPTGATFAFCSALERLLEKHKPDLIAVAWDSPEPTFRHDQFEAYKANREAPPEDLPPQIDRTKEIVGLYHIPCLQMPGYEADDIIGTIARRAEAAGYEVYCVTPDKDFLQLVTERVLIYRPSRPGSEDEIVDIEGVKKRFGVAPLQVIDVLALMGDASDNVPGVRGIGEKTAIPLIQEFGSVENLYEHVEEIPKKGVRTKLIDGRDSALLSKELVTIHTEVPVEVTFEELHLDPPDVAGLKRMYEELGFKSLVARYAAVDGANDSSETAAQDAGAGTTSADQSPDGPAATEEGTEPHPIVGLSDVEHRYELVIDESRLASVVTELSGASMLSFDLETDSVDEMTATILGVALSAEPFTGYYIAVAAPERALGSGDGGLFDEENPRVQAATEGLPVEVVIRHLKPLLENDAIAKTGQNAKYDMVVLLRYDVEVTPIAFDTMLASYVLDSSQAHNMDALAERWLHYRPISITELIGKRGRGQLNMRDIDIRRTSEYACEDADVTLRLQRRLAEELDRQELRGVAEELEFPLVPVLAHMEHCGVYIDREALGDISRSLERTMTEIEAEIYELAGHPFNIGSPKQLQTVLFEELKLPPKKKTKTGYSTDQFVMEDLAAEHPLPDKILAYRQAAKLKSTYVDALPALVNPATGRVHTDYNQAVTSTGRLSSTNPNLQNIPIRSELGQEIRGAFVAGFEGGLILSADYSQVELRIMASITGDDALVAAFREGADIHTATAANVFDVPPEEVTQNMRRRAKEVNFGIMYGIGPFGLSRRLKIGRNEGQELITTYFRKYPGVQQYIADTLEKARTKGYVETLSGRRRYYPNIGAANQAVRSAEERAAINMPIQGTASDIIKLAMIDIDRELATTFPKVNMILQVHDELVFEVPAEQIDDVAAFVKQKMEGAFSLGEVPLIAETGYGRSWLAAH